MIGEPRGYSAAKQRARDFAGQAEEVREAFQKAFYKPEQGTYATGSQTAIAMPLVFGVAPDSARAGLVDQLVADVRRAGNHLTAGDIGYRYLLTALLEGGRSDVVFDMANRTDLPSYGAQLAGGATSLTEAWDSNPDDSQNHCMLGHIEEWFYAGLARHPSRSADARLEAAYSSGPEPVGDLKSVDASWETFRGPVAVRWRIEGTSFHLSVDVPPGVTAEVAVPARSEDAISEGGVPWQKAAGVRLLRREEKRTVFEVGSGHYEFVK